MKIVGFLLLVAGWSIALTALGILKTQSAMAAFILAGMVVEVIGLVLVSRAHLLPRGSRK